MARPKKETIIKNKDVEIGKRIASLRKETKNPTDNKKNISQEYLASVLDISVQQIRNYEHGRQGVPLDKITQLSTIFNVSTDYLLCKSNYKNAQEERKIKKDNIFKRLGKAALNKDDTINKIEKINRITELGTIIEKILDIYGKPDTWNNAPIENATVLLSFLDDQLEQSLKTFFKYIYPVSGSNKYDVNESEFDIDGLIDGVGIILEDVVKAISDISPEGMTESEFNNLINTDYEYKQKVMEQIDIALKK